MNIVAKTKQNKLKTKTNISSNNENDNKKHSQSMCIFDGIECKANVNLRIALIWLMNAATAFIQ